jgi:Holliday junction resolvase-like predicted endonuclease
VRLPYTYFDDGSSDHAAGGSTDALTSQDSGDGNTSAGTPRDGDDSGDAVAFGDDDLIPAPLSQEVSDTGIMTGAPDFRADGVNGFFGAEPANATAFGNGGDDPNPWPGSGNGGFGVEGALGAPSAGLQDPAVSARPAAPTGRISDDGSSSSLPASGLSGQSDASIPAAAFDEPSDGNPSPDSAASGGSPSPAAASPGNVLPLVGDLGVIYQAPTQLQSDSGGSSGSTPASSPSGNSSGFVINVSYDQSVSSLPAGFVAAVNYVVSYYESIFTAPITVNIDVGYGEIDGQQLQSDALGESETFLGDYSYSSIISALAAVDPSAAASLPSSMPVSGTMWVGTAEAKALGLPLEQPSTDIDGYAGFSDVYPFTYNPNDRAVSGEYDFIGVVEHEFTEVMGRIDLFGESIGGTTGYSLLDMFHYTSPADHTYTGLTTNYFSANGGTTDLDYFNDNPQGDLGDWAGAAGADSYLAFTPTGQEDTVSQSDSTEMNALGYGIAGQSGSGSSTPPQPANTTADMILDSDGTYEIYDIGGNAILQAGPLGQISTQWQVAGLGGFDGTDTSDMILRNGSGVFEIYDVANNAFTGNTTLGQVGSEWSVSGFGDFSSRAGETDMLMRNSNTGAFEVYDISNNAITVATGMGQVGLDWQVSGFGDFSSRVGETDMLMRSSNTGAFEVYDISDNQITSAAAIGQVGLDWQVAGFGDFSGNVNETDMLMRNSNTGAFEVYDIANNQITFAGPIGQIGLEWQAVGFGPMGGAGKSDLLMRDSSTGVFEVYDIANNQITSAAPMGQVGSEWSAVGISADSPGGSSPANAQLTQAMASFAPSGSTAGTGEVLGQSPIQPPTPISLITPSDQAYPAG